MIKDFPIIFTPKRKYSININDHFCQVLKTRNLKIIKQEESCFGEIVYGNDKICFAYMQFMNVFCLTKLKKFQIYFVPTPIQAKPQVVKLTNEYFALWYKSIAQIQILNIENMAIEQSFFLPRRENWL